MKIRGRTETIQSVNKISKDTQEGPGDQRKLAVTQNSVKDSQLKTGEKNSPGAKW